MYNLIKYHVWVYCSCGCKRTNIHILNFPFSLWTRNIFYVCWLENKIWVIRTLFKKLLCLSGRDWRALWVLYTWALVLLFHVKYYQRGSCLSSPFPANVNRFSTVYLFNVLVYCIQEEILSRNGSCNCHHYVNKKRNWKKIIQLYIFTWATISGKTSWSEKILFCVTRGNRHWCK